ncbi:MAG: hypothetical protein H6622_13230 [Halobacteriovoraceae bacterium]|nr:hypothetical protein [Halobacteriovoraceae bacterium]
MNNKKNTATETLRLLELQLKQTDKTIELLEKLVWDDNRKEDTTNANFINGVKTSIITYNQ